MKDHATGFSSEQTHWAVNGVADSTAFRAVMRRVVTGVTVITTRHGGRPWGMTVSAFAPVCMDPPTLLICLNLQTVTARHVQDEGRFAVNLLSQSQIHVSQFCSTPGEQKYLEDFIVSDAELPSNISMPVLRHSVATFDCRAIRTMEMGTHLIVVASIETVLAPEQLDPLLYGQGRYLQGVDLAGAQA